MTPQQKFEIKELILSFSKKISELQEATTFGNQDFFAIAQNDGSEKVSKKVNIQTFADYIRAGVSVSGATVYGVASPSGTPGTLPTNNDGVWFATAAGTYTNFGGITVSDTPKLIFYDYETQTWSAEELWKGGPNVVDNLTSTSSTDALSAKQGKVLKDLIDALPTVGPGTLNTTLTTAQSTNASEALSGTVKLHKVSKTGSYNDLLNKPTIPAEVTETTVSGWGFTKNTGTVTAVKVNDQTYNPTSGVVDLGTIGQGATVGTLNTDNSTAQSVNSSESFSGTVKLHKVSKTGSYNDLLNKPSIPAAITSLNDIPDVTITSASNNQILKYNGSGWVNGAAPSGGAQALNDLTDVTISSPSAAQLLTYDGSKWVNGTMGTLNYQKVTSAQYASMQSGGTLQSNILYIIVD